MNMQAPVLELDRQESELARLVMQTFNTLSSQKDLSPRNPIVNETLTRYVNAIIHGDHNIQNKNNIFNDYSVRDVTKPLRAILSKAEFAMEQYFAEMFLNDGPMPLSGLSRFWYRANYKSLVNLELSGLKEFFKEKDVLADQRPIAFIGSGPLPLTAIDLYEATGIQCVCIEMNPRAAMDSRQLIENLGLSDAIKVVKSNGADMDYSGFSVVFVAALAEGRKEILSRITATAKDTIVGIRSADGLKKLLYAPVDIHEVEGSGLTHRGTTIATDEVVNSTCFFQLKHG